MTIFSKIQEKIDYVLVQGDTSSAFAVALSAYNHGIKITHFTKYDLSGITDENVSGFSSIFFSLRFSRSNWRYW